jgi:hypothetical protein
VPGPPVYIHETIRIGVQHRKAYLDHFCSWGATTRKLYDMRCYGVWATVGSSAAWPEAIVLWELDDLDALVRMLSGEFAFLRGPQAPIPDHYALFWGGAPEGVTEASGFDRILVPGPGALTLAQALGSGVRGVGYYHEVARVTPPAVREYLALYDAHWRPFLEELGLRLLGTWRTRGRNDSEALALWALPEWDAWARLERALDDSQQAREWRRRCAPLGADWEAKLLTPAARSPLDTGIPL